MKLFSSAFNEGDSLPRQFTCSGKDILPPLQWSDVPDKTKSFVLVMVDPDAPGTPFLHMLMYNIPNKIRKIDHNHIPSKAKFLKNGFGKKKYNGPCPPEGEEHTYNFMIMALSKILPYSSVKQLMTRAESYTLDNAVLSCKFKKPTPLVKKADISTAIPLEQQKAILHYAPKDKLWFLLDFEDAWFDTLKALPEPYRIDFAKLISKHGESSAPVLAKMYVRQKVKREHLIEVIVANWNPVDLMESSVWLRKNGFLRRPLMPLNLRA